MIVSLGERSYPVTIAYPAIHAIDYHALLAPHLKNKQVAIITNELVWSLHGKQLSDLLNMASTTCVVLPDGEQHKSLDSVTHILDHLIHDEHTRQTTLISFGGGVITDITGFVASIYQRGVSVIHIPTTLLAQVDACIGGKTGINYDGIKNTIGTFYQPQAVIIDGQWLSTLPAREYQSGLAEIIKMALAFDVDFFNWLEKNAERLLQREPDSVLYAINRCCELKSYIVTQDECDNHIRALLNLGHTFAHAIESGLNYACLHGEAVAIGLVLAAKLSVNLQYLSASDAHRIEKILHEWQLPTHIPKAVTSDDLWRAMAKDKKNTTAGLQFIILQKIGQAHRMVIEKQHVMALLEQELSCR